MAVTANPLRYDDPKKLIDAAKKDSQRNSLDNNNTNNGTAFDEIWKGIEELKKIQEGQKKLIIAHSIHKRFEIVEMHTNDKTMVLWK